MHWYVSVVHVCAVWMMKLQISTHRQSDTAVYHRTLVTAMPKEAMHASYMKSSS